MINYVYLVQLMSPMLRSTLHGVWSSKFKAEECSRILQNASNLLNQGKLHIIIEKVEIDKWEI